MASVKGAVPDELAVGLAQQAGQWPARVGSLCLQRYGRFDGPRIVRAGPGQHDGDYPTWLGDLYGQLLQRLEPYGFVPDHPIFRPHVSLLRRAGPGDLPELAQRTLAWVPAQCVLLGLATYEPCVSLQGAGALAFAGTGLIVAGQQVQFQFHEVGGEFKTGVVDDGVVGTGKA